MAEISFSMFYVTFVAASHTLFSWFPVPLFALLYFASCLPYSVFCRLASQHRATVDIDYDPGQKRVTHQFEREGGDVFRFTDSANR